MKNVNLSKVTAVVAKIVEIFHWVGLGILFVSFILTIVFSGYFRTVWNEVKEQYEIETGISSDVSFKAGIGIKNEAGAYSLEASILDDNGELDMGAIRIILIAGMFDMILYAMIFRNAHLIAKNTLKPELSWFCPDNIRMVREIGIFAIASPVIGFIMMIISAVFVKTADFTVGISGLLIGLLVLFLTQFFSRGAELEEEVEGLV